MKNNDLVIHKDNHNNTTNSAEVGVKQWSSQINIKLGRVKYFHLFHVRLNQ